MATLPVILLNGTTADANQMMADLYEIYSNIDPSNVNASNKTGTGPFVLRDGATLNNPTINGSSFSPTLVPVGSIIPFYDFNGALTFNTSYWAYCNGQTLTVLGIGAQTLPDQSGRYLVGFGTDGGGNIGSATWATAAVGNANHQINLSHAHTVASHTHTVAGHSHTVDAHSHTVNSHTHGLGAHTHGAGTLSFNILQFWNSLGSRGINMNYTSLMSTFRVGLYSGGSSPSGPILSAEGYAGSPYADNGTVTTYGGTGTTASASGNTDAAAPGTNSQSPGTSSVSLTTNSTAPGTDSQLSSTQSIQPSSIRVRYIMRIQ